MSLYVEAERLSAASGHCRLSWLMFSSLGASQHRSIARGGARGGVAQKRGAGRRRNVAEEATRLHKSPAAGRQVGGRIDCSGPL